MTKVYVRSERKDAELEQLIYEMSVKQLRTFVYGIARGWGFDETCAIAESIPPLAAEKGDEMKKKILTFKESPLGGQLHAGNLKGSGGKVWHSGDHMNYWCGSWHERTAEELYKECQTVMRDLLKNHPELAD